jgi:3-oxoacyl-[acyl-carrier protein] reductase
MREVSGDEQALNRRAALNPMRRLGRPEEVGDLVAFLCSARAEFLTGASILIDGGEARSVS